MAKHGECPLLRRCCLVPAYRRGFERAQCRAPSSVTAADLVQRDEPVEPAFLFVDAALRGPKSPSGQSAPSPWRIVQGLNSGCPLPMPCALGLDACAQGGPLAPSCRSARGSESASEHVQSREQGAGIRQNSGQSERSCSQRRCNWKSLAAPGQT